MKDFNINVQSAKTIINQTKGSNYLDKVEEFHKAFEHPILDTPQIPDLKRSQLRYELLREELKELKDAIDQNNLVDIFDAFCDLQYVLSGAILEFGGKDLFDKLFNAVHASNMSKACNTKEEAIATQTRYMKDENTDSYYIERDGLFFVYRKSDNKTLKSVWYKPASLQRFFI